MGHSFKEILKQQKKLLQILDGTLRKKKDILRDFNRQ